MGVKRYFIEKVTENPSNITIYLVVAMEDDYSKGVGKVHKFDSYDEAEKFLREKLKD